MLSLYNICRDCNQTAPYFQIFTFCYETNAALREYEEK